MRAIGRKPGLFLIGAMKSGTNYLRKLLGAHPSIFMTEADEPSYFVDPPELKAIWPEMWAHGYWRDESNYLRLFESAGEATILGEASTNYTKRPLVAGVAERLQAFNRDARLIYLLRDPVERAISHYWHMVRYHSEYRPIAVAMRQDPQYVSVSHYAMQLEPFRDRFGLDRIAVLTHEQLIGDPDATVQSLYRWLDLDGAGVDVSGAREPEHVTPDVIRMPRWHGISRKLWHSPATKSLVLHLPQALRSGLRHAIIRDVRRQEIDVTDATDFLRSVQRRQVDELADILGRSFPEWATLNATPDRPGRSPAGRRP